MGIRLHRIKSIRLLYGEAPFGISPIDFDEPENKPIPNGHAIAARITSENPDEVRRKNTSAIQNIRFFMLTRVLNQAPERSKN